MWCGDGEPNTHTYTHAHIDTGQPCRDHLLLAKAVPGPVRAQNHIKEGKQHTESDWSIDADTIELRMGSETL